MTSVLDNYRELRHSAAALADEGGYDLAAGEMNPEIARCFAAMMAGDGLVAAWEPFANPDGRTIQVFRDAGVELTSATLVSGHPDVLEADSSTEEPRGEFDGVLFHPPYFGSKPFTTDPRDMSQTRDEDEWLVMMESAADMAVEHLLPGGLVCAVGRRYRHGGKEIRLDEWLVMAFCGPLVPVEVWTSEPDVAIVMRWGE